MGTKAKRRTQAKGVPIDLRERSTWVENPNTAVSPIRKVALKPDQDKIKMT
jgi:hypothetical protein